MKTTNVVTGFVMRGGRLLLLQRSDRVGSYQGFWAAVSGYLEHAEPLEQMYTEIEEELGVERSAVQLLAAGSVLDVVDGDRRWRVHPFRFELSPSAKVVIDWEHDRYRWAAPEVMRRLNTVPGLWEAYQLVAARVPE